MEGDSPEGIQGSNGIDWQKSAPETGIGVDKRELAKIEAHKKRIREKKQDDENAKLASEFSFAAKKMKENRESKNTDENAEARKRLLDKLNNVAGEKQPVAKKDHEPIDANQVKPEEGIDYDVKEVDPHERFKRPRNEVKVNFDTSQPIFLDNRVVHFKEKPGGGYVMDTIKKNPDGTMSVEYSDLDVTESQMNNIHLQARQH